jgi:phosphatidate cytidylyltransferase
LFKGRVLVALIGVPAGIAVIVLGGYVFFGAALLLTLFGLHEYYTLIRPYQPNLLVGYAAGLGCVAGAFFGGVGGMALAILGLMVLLFLWSMAGPVGSHLVGRIAITALGVLWVGLGFAQLVLLRDLENGATFALLAVGGTWASDTFAFVIGKLMGHHRLAPRISPKKSVEGAVGGLLGGVLFALVVKIYSPWLPLKVAAVLGLVVAVAGLCGDLFESAFKRDLRVKDSGRALRGHGGVLDRFDSLLFAGAATYWAVLLLLPEVVGPWPR